MGFLNAAVAILATMALLFNGASSDSVSEPVAKAAVLYNLATYVTWPEPRAAAAELVIGVAGPDVVLSALAAIEGRAVNGRVIRVRELRQEDDPGSCDILYIPSTYRQAATLLRAIGDRPVLTVSDGPDALRDGSAVRLYFQRSRLRLEIELTAVERARVRISSKVLSLSRVLKNGDVVTHASRP